MVDASTDVTISRLSAKIDQIQVQIDHVNTVTDEAITKLETQKRQLRTFSPNYQIVQKNIQEIAIGHDQVVDRLLQKQTNVKGRKASLDELDFTVAQLDREIARIQAERDRALFALNRKREEILAALRSTESFTAQIHQLQNQISLITKDHEADMATLQKEIDELMARDDLSPSEKEFQLQELKKKIQEKEDLYQQHMKSLEQQKEESLSMLKVYTEEEATEIRKSMNDEIDQLEAMKVGASPSQIEAINQRIQQLRDQLEDLDILGQLKERGLTLTPSGRIRTKSGTIYTLEEAKERGLLDGIDVMKLLLDEKLKQEGLTRTASGNIVTKSGRILTLEEAKDLGLIGDSLLEVLQTTSKRSSLSMSSESTHMSSEDVSYIKAAVGKPLVLALAEICMKQPRDPIHYLGHWLFKYRYNQEIDQVKKREIEELLSARERLRAEAWHKEVEDVARTAVLEMVFRAHEEVMQHELNAQLAKLAMEEETEHGGEGEGGGEVDELAEEAKDVLGEYTGPPAGQRRI